jgi:hypothetical protein
MVLVEVLVHTQFSLVVFVLREFPMALLVQVLGLGIVTGCMLEIPRVNVLVIMSPQRSVVLMMEPFVLLVVTQMLLRPAVYLELLQVSLGVIHIITGLVLIQLSLQLLVQQLLQFFVMVVTHTNNVLIMVGAGLQIIHLLQIVLRVMVQVLFLDGIVIIIMVFIVGNPIPLLQYF